MIGSRTRVKVVKNKVAPPFRVCEFDIIYGKGICKIGSIIDMAVDSEIINKAGSWFSYGDIKLGQGKEKARDYLTQNIDTLSEIEAKVRQTLEKKN